MPLESMASVLAVLAYPEAGRERIGFERALIFQTVRNTARDRPAWGEQVLIPGSVLCAPEEIDAVVGRGLTTITNQRAVAAQIGLGLLAPLTGKKPTVQGKPFTINAMISAMTETLANARDGEFKGISKSTLEANWKNGKPVVHIAIAFRTLLNTLRPELRSFSSLLDMDDGAERLIHLADCARNALLSLSDGRAGPTVVPQTRSFGMIQLVKA
jgi:hypothetical protein